MMGTLATVLAGSRIRTHEACYWAEVEGHIENVDNVLKITQINVTYHLKAPKGKADEARAAFSSYITFCPAAQSVIGCIEIKDDIEIEEIAE